MKTSVLCLVLGAMCVTEAFAAPKKKTPEQLAAEKALADLHAEYDRVTVVDRQYLNHGCGYGELAEENTLEYRIAKCDEAAAKSPDEATRNGFLSRKVTLLRLMRRYDEAMALAKELKSEALQAEVCRARAARYYLTPDEKHMREAIAHYLKSIEGREDNRNLRQVADDYFALKDYKGAIEVLRRLSKDKPDSWIGVKIADAYYETGDYETAVAWYGKYPGFKDRSGIPSSYQRYAGALYALGRYEECLALVDKLPTVGTFKDTNAYYRHILMEKIAESKKGGK